jgi:hypothetical protein
VASKADHFESDVSKEGYMTVGTSSWPHNGMGWKDGPAAPFTRIGVVRSYDENIGLSWRLYEASYKLRYTDMNSLSGSLRLLIPYAAP